MNHAHRHRSLKWIVVGIGLAGGIVFAAFYFAPRPKFNVLLITLDTTRADHIGCYGDANAFTPALDELARNGVLFERAYTTVPLTLPSHASILTGLYPPENGIHLNGRGPLPEQIPTLAETLKKSGYSTGAFVGAVVLYGKTGLNQGFDVYDDDMAGGERHGHESHLMRSGRIVVDSALAWLSRQEAQPFFCWVHLYDPHAPFEGHPEEFQNRFADRPYDGDIAFADQQVGRLIDFLRQRRVSDRTLVVVAGDHGEGFGEHDEQEHGFLLYDSTLRVPLIVAGPTITRKNHREPASVSLTDIYPSILGVLQIPWKERVSGVSFEPSLRGGSITPRDCYSETEACYAAYGWAPQASVANDRWKFINSVRPELFDLQNDPSEKNNLAESEPDQLEQMRELFTSVRAKMADVPTADVKHDPRHLQQLKALGYVGGAGDQSAADTSQPLPDIKDRLRYYNREIEARQLISSAPEQAIENLRGITAAVPDFTPAWLTLGTALQTLNRADEAIEAYQAALANNSQSADAHFELAKLYFGQGDRDKAVQQYKEALGIDPHYAMAHINLAAIFAELGNSEEARQHFEQGLEEFPDSTVGRFNFGMFLYRQGEYEAAMEHLSRAVVLDPKIAQVHFQLGLVKLALEIPDEAAHEFQKTLMLNPRHTKAAEHLRQLRERK